MKLVLAYSGGLDTSVLVHWFALVVKFELVFRASHPENLESVYLWHKFSWTLGQKFRELLQENVGETCAKVSSINVKLLLSWNVDVLAPWAVNFHSGGG